MAFCFFNLSQFLIAGLQYFFKLKKAPLGTPLVFFSGERGVTSLHFISFGDSWELATKQNQPFGRFVFHYASSKEFGLLLPKQKTPLMRG